MIGWNPPANGRVKLNTDGACKKGITVGCDVMVLLEIAMVGGPVVLQNM
jgi:hypothetical protein